ncbi:MAG: hydroxylamine oxidoreductase [Lentisphaerae bacterium]|jgi:hydroxylamine dehydrogenase|nr:hydroxylamine oxidoreductase [Lentisphaerota bacterium]MBT4816163.1 hydroxylamine oxidoreductase [Lentisphaerota bacterium]MBT5605564.1 hydroxylamine oxidoreductase [Lentisphaerota bacterium]MBT7056841.1 hydroxylamine oxidoreductase [Lentisphaerota bacterium]MBT7845373.1 hydroxylamine oxidoreductase [Lentisphaerota bacterium]
MKKLILPLVLLTVIALRVAVLLRPSPPQTVTITSQAIVIRESARCVRCHTKKTPGVVASWRNSNHAASGVGCYECHQAKEGEPDATKHFGELVSVIVSPKDCGRCHETETTQFLASHHAKGGEVLGSLDNYLGEVVEGMGANVSGCQQCHGSTVKVMKDGTLHPGTWPNFGIGRINPDGTAGSCSACHSRHDFSVAQARTPETCGRCHLGPDHPQKEVYEESKHAIAYRSHMDEMNMKKSQWVVGVDYSAAPVCATCHVSATPNQPRTHDIGQRLSWNIRAKVSFKTKDSEQKRKAMQEVCANCHNPNYVKNFYKQFDAGVELYNGKFAEPAQEIMGKLKKAEKIDSTPFNEEIEWIFFYLWHHEGRRARNGLAMMGPDYVQWHGFYEIAERFYIEFVKEAEHLLPGVTKEILARPEHKWFKTPLSPDERKDMKGYYDGRATR